MRRTCFPNAPLTRRFFDHERELAVDREPTFDPRTDSIVRVEARRLRSKFAAYYATVGREDTIEIGFPTGSYVPFFRLRQPRSQQAPSIAVLPFLNLSPDPENEYFSDGLTQELITTLAQVKGLRVVARASAFQFKSQSHDTRKIGEQLNVGTLLEGSVRKSGGKLRIAAQLINAADGYHLWAEIYERPLHDVFAIQEEIARSITENLKIEFVGRSGRLLANRTVRSEAAYQLYLKGRYFWNQRTPGSLLKSLECFNKAIAEDPNYSTAYAGLADCYIFLGTYALPPHEVMPKAKAAALQALTVDEALAEAHAALGAVRTLYDWNWAEAEKELNRAIELNPESVTAYQWYALSLAIAGHTAEAVAQIKRAQQIDPISVLTNSLVGMFLSLDRQYGEAIKELQNGLELDPNFYRTYWNLGLAYYGTSRLKRSH